MEKNTVDKSLKYQHGLKIFPLHKKMPGSICSCGQEFIAIQKCAKDMPRLSPPINHYPVMESHSMNSGNHIDATNMSLDLQLEKDESSIFDSAWATLGEEALAKF